MDSSEHVKRLERLERECKDMSISEERKKKIEQFYEQNHIFSEMVKKLSQMGYSNKEIAAGLNIPESSVIVFKYKE